MLINGCLNGSAFYNHSFTYGKVNIDYKIPITRVLATMVIFCVNYKGLQVFRKKSSFISD